jgi:hypothetical protein
MSQPDVKFDNIMNFEGRNGYFQSSGVGIETWREDRIAIFPYTSKGVPGRCEIQIEKSKIGEFIEALKKYL